MMHWGPINLKIIDAGIQVAGSSGRVDGAWPEWRKPVAEDGERGVAEDKLDSQIKAPDETGRRPKGQGRAAVPPPKALKPAKAQGAPKEIGGRKGPDPTRYGDWEKNGRCIDF